MQKLREICDAHQTVGEKPRAMQVTDSTIDNVKKEIELDELNSCMHKMDFDVKPLLNWQQICVSTDQNAHSKNQEWVPEAAFLSSKSYLSVSSVCLM